MLRRIAVLLALCASSISLLAVPPASPEEDYRRAMSLLFGNNQRLADRDDALNLLRSAAGQGFVPAQTALGSLYEATHDIQQAIRWYTEAAGKNDWIAQFSLGRIYFKGTVVIRDVSAAKKWLALAAASGDGGSAFYLGMLNDEGQGTATNYAEAAKWYRQSAEAGNPFAQEKLAILLLKGLGGEHNPQEAYVWLLVASELGNRQAEQRLQFMEGDIGRNGAEAARRQALDVRDRILSSVQRACGSWADQYFDMPAPPPLASQIACETTTSKAAAN
jgi:TPR repeat protein